MTRAEHLQWAKDRAIVYAGRGDTVNAVSSLVSDLGKHPDTEGHAGLRVMVMMVATGEFDRPGALRHFIEGFN